MGYDANCRLRSWLYILILFEYFLKVLIEGNPAKILLNWIVQQNEALFHEVCR